MNELYLVTGAGGFVGRHLVEHLSQKGIRVRAMVRSPAQTDGLQRTAEVVVADLTIPKSLTAALEGVYGVYNVAGLFRQAGVPEKVFYDVNSNGVRNLFEAAIDAGVQRIVHCSTNGVHSNIKDPPANESASFNPSDVYQKSKLAGEEVAMSYFQSEEIRGIVIRPAMIYGPGDTRILKLFQMIANRRFFYVGKGNAYTHWIDVRDLAQAFFLGMVREDINGEAFLIGGAKYNTLRETVQEISRQLGVPEPWVHLPAAPVMAIAILVEAACRPFGLEPPIFPRRVSFFLKHRAFDTSKSHTVLGFEPRQDFSGEVADIIEDYRSRGLLKVGKS